MTHLPPKAEYLKAVKKNQTAFMQTRTILPLAKKELAAMGATIIKVVHTRYVRLKCDYLRLENEARREHGQAPLDKAGPLPWGEWAIDGVLLQMKQPDGKPPIYYLRYYKSDRSDYDDIHFIVDDVVIDSGKTYDRLLALMRKKRGKHPPVCKNVRWENIVELTLCDNDLNPETDVV